MKTLIVEDNEITRLVFENQIQSLGYDVSACADAETALEAYRQAFYPLIILDLGLPGMDGFEFCRQIRALPQKDHSMILVITAYDRPEDLREALDAGADDYLIKPVSMELLRMRLTIIERQFRNLARRKRAEEALRESEHHLKEAQAIAHIGHWKLDPKTEEVTGSDELFRIFGLNREEATLEAFADVVHPEDREYDLYHIRRGMEEGMPWDIEHRLICKDGTEKTIHAIGEVITDKTGKVVLLIGTVQDITKRKRAEETLRRSEQQYRLLVENVADGIGIVRERKFVFVNDTLASMFGFTPAQLIGKSPVDFFHRDYRAQFRRMYAQLEQGITEPHSLPVLQCIMTRDNREVWMEGAYSVITWEGKPAILINTRDITKRKLREMAIEDDREDLRRENIQLRATIKERYRFGDIVGKSQVMQEVYELILKASASEKDVLITGESGTGKELIAHTIHQLSTRQGEAFVPVNCGAVPEALFEREFFGHRKGAFTGADRDKQGFFDAAHQGTLFLDEVGEMSPNIQVKLLRAIEGGEYMPIGETAPKKVDVRIIAATNRDLTEQVEKGLMREDFFYRIHVIVISMPPLRERREDIPLLIEHFVKQYSQDEKTPPISGRMLETFYNYDWPGNIRQLQNVLYRYLTVGQLDFAGPRSAKSVDRGTDSGAEFVQEGAGLRETMENFEKYLIARVLEQHRWHRGKTAAQLNIDPKTLYRKMKQHRLI